MTYLAHSKNAYEHTQSLSDHLTSVADLAAQFAATWGGGDLAHLAGLLHDLGKYGDLFQKRLRGEVNHIDHWSAGATALSEHFGQSGQAAALAVQGHHLGLQQAEKACLKPDRLHQPHPPEFRLSAPCLEELLQRFAADDLALPEEPPESNYSGLDGAAAAAMLDLRMLYSCLVDADGLDTEAHCSGTADGAKRYREPGPTLDAERDLKALLDRIQELAGTSRATEKVNKLRADLLEACLKAAEGPQGCFTLSAPTGSGKTLSMLAFALKHALTHGLRRIVMVIPYLSIIDQTVAEYRKVLSQVVPPQELDRYLLEDHSLAGTRDGRSGGRPSDEQDDSARLLAQNWDTPILVTTSVQFLESLFANRSRACRKLHRLAGSVILFDEVQTLRTDLAVPTLATLSHLSERYGASVVFSTATQPAFTHLNEAVEWFADSGWQPREIVPAELDLFGRARRVKVQWPQRDHQRPSWETLAGDLAQVPQVLCIVNLKRHAQALLEALSSELEPPDLCHLSTSMCPAHRARVLERIRQRLSDGLPCHLISTQCVEAGVDLDFPLLYRAWGPLDSIAQAAGRCNRNGRLDLGTVHLFFPEDDGRGLYPGGGYGQAAGAAETVLQDRGAEGMDLADSALFESYYRELYDLQDVANVDRQLQDKDSLLNAVFRQHFVQVAERYRVIDQDTVNVLVPYEPEISTPIADELRRDGLSRTLIQRARPYTVGVYRRRDDALWDWLEPVPIRGGRKGEYADDWFIFTRPEGYDDLRGLLESESGKYLGF